MAAALLTCSCRIQVPLVKQTAAFSTFSNVYRKSLFLKTALNNTTTQEAPTTIVRKMSSPLKSAAESGRHHATLWSIERGLSISLLAVVPAAFGCPSQGLDALMSVSFVMHVHWGLDAIITDYVRTILVGKVVPKFAQGVLLFFSVATLGGLFYFTFNDIGVANAIRKLWSVKGQ